MQNIGNDRSNSSSVISASLNAAEAGGAADGWDVDEEAAAAEAGAADAGEDGGAGLELPAAAATDDEDGTAGADADVDADATGEEDRNACAGVADEEAGYTGCCCRA